MIGRTISHYRILERLGEGGMGVVYKAEDIKLRRIVALKFLPPELTRNLEAKERFVREAQAASALDHINICTIYEIDETENGEMFISMACYKGETLKQKIEKGWLEPGEAIRIAMQIGQGLAKAHEQGIVHRDIKPANLFITDDGYVKIVDFGLAKLAGQTGLTRTDKRAGTAAYMSPEQVRGQATDHRTDIWSLGVTLYEMLAGQLPFRGEYEMSVMYSILNESPQPVSVLRSGIPAGLEQIVSRAMLKNPAERYQSAGDLIADLASPEKDMGTATSIETAALSKPRSSVAVLPFANLSADPEQEYFCDGMAENMINALTQVRDLRVVARTSAFSFRGKETDVREIGRKLNVESLLEGSVQKAGNRLRITVQLVNVADGYHLWSEKYDRNLEDVFAIQDEISQAIVDKLKVRVPGVDKAKLRKRYTEDPEAYNLYLKGRWFSEKYTEEGFNKAVEYFRLAIEKDPHFALAVAGLSDAYVGFGLIGCLPKEVAYGKAKVEAEKAIEMDDALAEAHLALANIRLWFDWDLTAAEREFKRAWALNPSNAEVIHQNAHMLVYLGHSEEAVMHMKQAVKLEPLSILMNACLGQILYLARRYDEAIEQLEKTIEMDPNFYSPYIWLAFTYALKGMYEQATETVRGLTTSRPGGKAARATLGYICSVSGRTGEAKDICDELKELSKKETVTPYYLARIYAGLGESEHSIECLNKCYEERDASLAFLKTDPVWDNLRHDTGFVDLIKKMGFEA
ncbi:MAG: protein kinase [Candidatus Eisenbacteria bacterium]|nr:protein kinase [Candidatus Eisenbacteria bacterium]